LQLPHFPFLLHHHKQLLLVVTGAIQSVIGEKAKPSPGLIAITSKDMKEQAKIL